MALLRAALAALCMAVGVTGKASELTWDNVLETSCEPASDLAAGGECRGGRCGFRDCDLPVSCTGGGCLFDNCSDATCSGGACRFVGSTGGTCTGGGCEFSAPKTIVEEAHCTGGGCTLEEESVLGGVETGYGGGAY